MFENGCRRPDNFEESPDEVGSLDLNRLAGDLDEESGLLPLSTFRRRVAAFNFLEDGV